MLDLGQMLRMQKLDAHLQNDSLMVIPPNYSMDFSLAFKREPEIGLGLRRCIGELTKRKAALPGGKTA